MIAWPSKAELEFWLALLLIGGALGMVLGRDAEVTLARRRRAS